MAGWNGEVTEELRRKLRALRGLCQDIVELRRGGHSGGRLKMEREQPEREREKSEEEVIAHFERWIKNLAVRNLVQSDGLSDEEKQRRMREIFGLPSKPPAETAAAGQNQVKLSKTKMNHSQFQNRSHPETNSFDRSSAANGALDLDMDEVNQTKFL